MCSRHVKSCYFSVNTSMKKPTFYYLTKMILMLSKRSCLLEKLKRSSYRISSNKCCPISNKRRVLIPHRGRTSSRNSDENFLENKFYPRPIVKRVLVSCVNILGRFHRCHYFIYMTDSFCSLRYSYISATHLACRGFRSLNFRNLLVIFHLLSDGLLFLRTIC